jgi:hypothetical protein
VIWKQGNSIRAGYKCKGINLRRQPGLLCYLSGDLRADRRALMLSNDLGNCLLMNSIAVVGTCSCLWDRRSSRSRLAVVASIMFLNVEALAKSATLSALHDPGSGSPRIWLLVPVLAASPVIEKALEILDVDRLACCVGITEPVVADQNLLLGRDHGKVCRRLCRHAENGEERRRAVCCHEAIWVIKLEWIHSEIQMNVIKYHITITE